MEKYEREMCTLVRSSGARVGKLPSARLRSLWREWSLVEFGFAWARTDREHIRWFLAWAEKRPSLLAEASRANRVRVCQAGLSERRRDPACQIETEAEDKLPLLMERISGQPGAWLCLTGLKPRAFERQLEGFVAVWEDHIRSGKKTGAADAEARGSVRGRCFSSSSFTTVTTPCRKPWPRFLV